MFSFEIVRCPFRPPSVAGAFRMSESVIAFMIWSYETLFWSPDVVLHECTPSFDVEGLATVFGAMYVILSFVFCPSDLGWPTRRRRRYTVLVHKTRRVIPFLVDQLMFSRLFFRRCMLEGHIFWKTTPDQAVQDFMDEKAVSKHLPTRDQDGLPWSCRSLLGQGYLQRLLGYERLCRKQNRPLKYIVNVHQKASFSKCVSNLVPALMTRTSHIWSMVYNRLLMPLECLEVMGLKVFRNGSDALSTDIGIIRLGLRGKLAQHQVAALAGNAMSQVAVGVALMLALGLSADLDSEVLPHPPESSVYRAGPLSSISESESYSEAGTFSADDGDWADCDEPAM